MVLMEKVSIVTMTHNRAEVLEKTLKAMLELDYPTDYEIIVVDDGSTDNTREVLDKFKGRIKVIHQERRGPCAARNTGMKAAKYPIVVNMDDDCIPAKEWLKDLMRGFDSPKVGVVSAFDIYGGTSTAFRKKVLDAVGLYDEEYFYYREDTDLVFRILDAGYEARKVEADFEHRHELPAGFLNGLKYAGERIRYHINDVLLFKKNPRRAKEFLDVRFGFLVNPLKDFGTVTGQWHRDKMSLPSLKLSSPRGIVFLENRSPLHALIIIALAVGYVAALKLTRLYGSIKYGKLLI
jgi:glycosyltransferase involved in cell wall biosynthesis